jgi:hypothetical protein
MLGFDERREFNSTFVAAMCSIQSISFMFVAEGIIPTLPLAVRVSHLELSKYSAWLSKSLIPNSTFDGIDSIIPKTYCCFLPDLYLWVSLLSEVSDSFQLDTLFQAITNKQT